MPCLSLYPLSILIRHKHLISHTCVLLPATSGSRLYQEEEAQNNLFLTVQWPMSLLDVPMIFFSISIGCDMAKFPIEGLLYIIENQPIA